MTRLNQLEGEVYFSDSPFEKYSSYGSTGDIGYVYVSLDEYRRWISRVKNKCFHRTAEFMEQYLENNKCQSSNALGFWMGTSFARKLQKIRPIGKPEFASEILEDLLIQCTASNEAEFAEIPFEELGPLRNSSEGKRLIAKLEQLTKRKIKPGINSIRLSVKVGQSLIMELMAEDIHKATEWMQMLPSFYRRRYRRRQFTSR